MGRGKARLFITVGAAATAVAVAFAVYFMVTASKKDKTYSVSSYDGVSSIVFEKDDNIANVEVKKLNYIQTTVVEFKNKDIFIERIKGRREYVRTFEYGDTAESKTELLLYSGGYYYKAVFDSPSSAKIRSLFANVSIPDAYVFFNESIVIEFGVVDGVPYGGSKTFSIDELNGSNGLKMNGNAYATYESLKEFYSKIDRNLYSFNDSEKTINIKVYSFPPLSNGGHFYDGYPIAVKFVGETVEISINLAIIIQ